MSNRLGELLEENEVPLETSSSGVVRVGPTHCCGLVLEFVE